MKKILITTLTILFTFIPQLVLAEILHVAEPTMYNTEATTDFKGYLEYNEIPEVEDEEYDSSNAVKLDNTTVKKVNISAPQSFNYESSSFNKKNENFAIFSSQMLPASKFSSQEYIIAPMSQGLLRKNGKFSYGTTYNSYLDSAEINYQTALFTKYDTKKFSLTTSYSKSTGNSYSYYSDKVYFIPEWKITKRLSLVDVIQSSTDMTRQKNEIILRYTPKRTNNDLKFEIGAGQSFTNNEYTKSSIKFSTSFKL